MPSGFTAALQTLHGNLRRSDSAASGKVIVSPIASRVQGTAPADGRERCLQRLGDARHNGRQRRAPKDAGDSPKQPTVAVAAGDNHPPCRSRQGGRSPLRTRSAPAMGGAPRSFARTCRQQSARWIAPPGHRAGGCSWGVGQQPPAPGPFQARGEESIADKEYVSDARGAEELGVGAQTAVGLSESSVRRPSRRVQPGRWAATTPRGLSRQGGRSPLRTRSAPAMRAVPRSFARARGRQSARWRAPSGRRAGGASNLVLIIDIE